MSAGPAEGPRRRPAEATAGLLRARGPASHGPARASRADRHPPPLCAVRACEAASRGTGTAVTPPPSHAEVTNKVREPRGPTEPSDRLRPLFPGRLARPKTSESARQRTLTLPAHETSGRSSRCQCGGVPVSCAGAGCHGCHGGATRRPPTRGRRSPTSVTRRPPTRGPLCPAARLGILVHFFPNARTEN